MKRVNTILAEIKCEAEKIDDFIRADLEKIRAEIDPLLLEVLEYGLLTGGKRIRPLLVVLAGRICGAKDGDVYRLGCAFEYLHAATLFHDDIIDGSEFRRGRASVFAKFGVVPAILAGDFLHALSMSIVGRMAGSRGLDVFCKATTGMVDGEFMQLRNTENQNMSEADYYDAIMGKTGLLISAACEIGAAFGGGTDEEVLVLKAYGTHLGCAFQIVDDLLDYLGDSAKTGKAVGNDLYEGKVTLPIIMAMGAASNEDRQALAGILAKEKRGITEFDRAYELIMKYDGFTMARERAELEIKRAVTGLDVFDAAKFGDELTILQGLAAYVLERQK